MRNAGGIRTFLNRGMCVCVCVYLCVHGMKEHSMVWKSALMIYNLDFILNWQYSLRVINKNVLSPFLSPFYNWKHNLYLHT